VIHDNHEVAMSPCDLDVLGVRSVPVHAFPKQIENLVLVENAIDGRGKPWGNVLKRRGP
jgi:hypothetical protein